jgi:hypothetical protein
MEVVGERRRWRLTCEYVYLRRPGKLMVWAIQDQEFLSILFNYMKGTGGLSGGVLAGIGFGRAYSNISCDETMSLDLYDMQFCSAEKRGERGWTRKSDEGLRMYG